MKRLPLQCAPQVGRLGRVAAAASLHRAPSPRRLRLAPISSLRLSGVSSSDHSARFFIGSDQRRVPLLDRSRRRPFASTSAAAPARRHRGRPRSPTEPDLLQAMARDTAAQRQAARELLATPLGAVAPERWLEADRLVGWWALQQSPESVELSLALVERLLRERSHPDAYAATHGGADGWIGADMLNQVLNNWRVVWWHQHEALVQYTPRAMWDKIEDFYATYGLVMNEKSFYLILEAEKTHASNVSHQSPMNDDGNHGDLTQMARDVLNRSIDLYETEGVTQCLPSTAFFNLVLKIWNVSGRPDEATTQCEAILDRMHQHGVVPNARSYRLLVHTWASLSTPDGARRAQDWLYHMHAQYADGVDALKPDAAAVALVIEAWSKSGAPDGSQHALSVYQKFKDLIDDNKIRVINALLSCVSQSNRIEDLKEMETLYADLVQRDGEENSGKAAPNATTYLILLTAYTRFSRPDKAKTVLLEMQGRYDNGEQQLRPTNAHFTSVISAYAQSNQKDRIENIRSMIKSMEEMSRRENDADLMTTLMTYNTFLSCFAKGHVSFAGSEAEKLLRELKARALAGDTRYTPDRFTYTSVINAYANSGLSKHAVRVFDDMYQDFLDGNILAQPDVQTCNTVLASFAKDKRSNDIVTQAIQFFERMKQLAAKGCIDKLDSVSYSTLIHVYANNSRREDREANAIKAEGILRQLQAAYRAGDMLMQPTKIAFNACLNAWAKAGRYDRAGDLFQTMYREFQEGNLKACPDIISFNTLIKAFAFARRQDSGEKAEEIVEKMRNLHKSGTLNVRPNSVTYTTLILCHVFSEKPGSLERADGILRLMDRLHKAGELDQGATKQAFEALRRGWSSSSLPGRKERVEQLREEIKSRFGASNEGEPD